MLFPVLTHAVKRRKRALSSTGSEDIPCSLAEKRRLADCLKDLEKQDVKSMRPRCDAYRAIRLLYDNALKRIIKLLEPHLLEVIDAADNYLRLGLHEDGSVKASDIQTSASISDLLSRMSVKESWDNINFLVQAVDAIPPSAIERDIAEAILSHYDLHLTIYERATLLKDDLTRRSETNGDRMHEGTAVVASNKLVPLEVTSSVSITEFTCDDCHRLQVRLLSAIYGIREEEIICSKAEARQSTTITFLIPSLYISAIIQCSIQLETVWVLLELRVMEVSIPGVFTFSPSVGCFLTLLRGRKTFTANFLRVTEVRAFKLLYGS